MPTATAMSIAAATRALEVKPFTGGGDTAHLADLQTTPNSPTQKRLVIKNAIMKVVVNDVQAALSKFSDLAEQTGGWIVTSNLNQPIDTTSGGVTLATLAIRVPAQQLEAVLQIIQANSRTIQSEAITGQDVTQQYADLSSKLHNLEAAEAQLRTIMDKAVNTQDVLAVYNQLVQKRGEIETIKGQMLYFDQSASYSLITLTLIPISSLYTPTPFPTPTPTPTVTITPVPFWNPSETIEDATSALNRVFVRLLQMVIWLIVFGLPLALLIGIPALMFRGWLIRRNNKPKSIPPA